MCFIQRARMSDDVCQPVDFGHTCMRWMMRFTGCLAN